MRIVLLLALMVPVCGAQTIEVENLFQPTPLSGMWKHQAGDDPRWGRPGVRRLGLAKRADAAGGGAAWAMDFPGTGSGSGCRRTGPGNRWRIFPISSDDVLFRFHSGAPWRVLVERDLPPLAHRSLQQSGAINGRATRLR